MTDITQLAKQAGAIVYEYSGEYSHHPSEYTFIPSQLAKLEQLLRDKFIAELGDPVATMNKSNQDRPYLQELRGCLKLKHGTPLYALKDERT